MKSLQRVLTLFLCIVMAAGGCITTDSVGPNGEIIRTHSIDTVKAWNIFMLALDAFDLITARIAAYEAQGEEISEPDELQLLIARGREALLQRGIDWLEREFAQMEPGQKKIRVPVGLMRGTAEAASAETGVPLRMSALSDGMHGIGVEFDWGNRPKGFDGVSPNDEPWRYAAAGFERDL